MAIRIPLIQINGRITALPEADKFHNKVVDSFVFEQTSPQTVWTITHNMNKFPSVTVTMSDNTEIHGSKKYINSNIVELTFSKPLLGKAFLN